jgi:glutathione S-transferase
VGDRITFADLAFISWNDRVDEILGVTNDQKFAGFPHLQDWHERMVSRPAWKRTMETRARCMSDQGLDWNGLPKGVTKYEDYDSYVQKRKNEDEEIN